MTFELSSKPNQSGSPVVVTERTYSLLGENVTGGETGEATHSPTCVRVQGRWTLSGLGLEVTRVKPPQMRTSATGLGGLGGAEFWPRVQRILLSTTLQICGIHRWRAERELRCRGPAWSEERSGRGGPPPASSPNKSTPVGEGRGSLSPGKRDLFVATHPQPRCCPGISKIRNTPTPFSIPASAQNRYRNIRIYPQADN